MVWRPFGIGTSCMTFPSFPIIGFSRGNTSSFSDTLKTLYETGWNRRLSWIDGMRIDRSQSGTVTYLHDGSQIGHIIEICGREWSATGKNQRFHGSNLISKFRLYFWMLCKFQQCPRQRIWRCFVTCHDNCAARVELWVTHQRLWITHIICASSSFSESLVSGFWDALALTNLCYDGEFDNAKEWTHLTNSWCPC